MSNSYLDNIYIQLKKAGAFGGKIIGAGGGGFFLMAVHDKEKFYNQLAKLNLRAIPFELRALIYCMPKKI